MTSHPPPQRRTDPRRFILGLSAAMCTGAGLVSVPFLLFGPAAIAVFFIAAAIWAVGLATLGTPIWLLLMWLHVRSRSAAMVLGALLSGGVIWAVDHSTAIAAVLAAVGAAAAFVGWGVAYRPETPLQEREIDEVFG